MMPRALANLLLGCGIAIAPQFYIIVLYQMLTRVGFDIRRHPLSLLALGDLGWIQTANFLVTGALALGCALGLVDRLAGGPGRIWVPVLIAMFGVGFILAALFPADPLPGFPPGAVTAMLPEPSAHAKGHGVGFIIAFGSLTAACFVLAHRFGARGAGTMQMLSIVVGISIVALIAFGMAYQPAAGVSFFAVGVVAFGWLGIVCASLLNEVEVKPPVSATGRASVPDRIGRPPS